MSCIHNRMIIPSFDYPLLKLVRIAANYNAGREPASFAIRALLSERASDHSREALSDGGSQSSNQHTW